MRLALSVAALVLAGLVLAGSGATGVSRDLEAGVGVGRPHTIAVVPMGVDTLDADGRLLAWSGRSRTRLQFFDRLTHRRTTIAPAPSELGISFDGPVLAGSRVLRTSQYGSNTESHGLVETAALAEPRMRGVSAFTIFSGEDGLNDLGSHYGSPVRLAAGGGTLLFSGYDVERGGGVWRMVGSHARRLPYKPSLLADIAVAGRKLATLDWVTTCGCDRLPAWSPDGREIAWNHGGTIWLMGADGSAQRRLSSKGAAGPESGPRWSPKGTTLVFEGDGMIRLIGRDGSNERPLVAGSLPAWSRDGSSIAFVRSDDVWLVGSDGSGERRLTNDGLKTNSRPAWSPDGRSIVVARGDSSATDLYLIDVATGATRDLAPGSLDEHINPNPAWSPDGAWIAFTRADSYGPGGSLIFAVRPDGTGLTKLSSAGELAFDHDPVWSPDGRRIAYLKQVIGPDELQVWVVNADGSGGRKLKKLAGESANTGVPAWSPDGTRVVVGDGGGGWEWERGGIYALDPAGGPARVLAPLSLVATVEIRDSRSAKRLRRWQLPKQRALGAPYGSVAVSGRYALATYWRYRVGYMLERYDIASGAVLGRARFPTSASRIELAGRWGVYRVGRRIYLLDVRTGRRSQLVATGAYPAGPVIEGKHVFWADDYRKGSRVREIVLG